MAVPAEPINHLFALLRIAMPEQPVPLAAMLTSNQIVARLVTDAAGTEYI